MTSEVKNGVKNIPLSMEIDEGLGEHHPWEKDHEYWKDLGKGFAKSAGRTRATTILLLCYERAMHGGGNHSMSYIHGTEAHFQIEHILPQSPKNWGSPWHDGSKTKMHEKWINSLGNQILLEDSRNSHVGNRQFNQKVPKAGCGADCTNPNLHYDGTSFHSAQNIVDYWKDPKTPNKWGPEAMEHHSIKIMNEVVEFFSP